MEGAAVEEMAAIQIDAGTMQIVDVFHAFAKSTREDDWARKYCHGLNKKFLMDNAEYENSEELVKGFRKWLRGKNVLEYFANDPRTENLWLPGIEVADLHLPRWAKRDYMAPHVMALKFKQQWAAVGNRKCCAEAHSSFWKVPSYRQNDAKEKALKRWGVHCALYDCLEAYFFYMYVPSDWL